MKKISVFFCAILLVLGTATVASATPIAITNPSFETYTGADWFNSLSSTPNANDYAYLPSGLGWSQGRTLGIITGYTPAATEGSIYAWLGPQSALWQDVETILPFATYSLTVDVGARNLKDGVGSYELVIYLNNSGVYTDLNTLSGNAANDIWNKDVTLTYTAKETDSGLIGVGIRDKDGGQFTGYELQITVDNFRLDRVSKEVPPAVPEPATMFLLGSGLIGIGIFVRKFKK